jgi:hypothetical protein
LNACALFRIFLLCLLFENPTGRQLLLERYTLNSYNKEEDHIVFSCFCVPNKWLKNNVKMLYVVSTKKRKLKFI